MNRLTLRTLTLLAAAASFAPSAAFSQPAEAPPAEAPAPAPVAPLSESLTGMARAEYEAGKILFADGDFAGSLMKFKSAYEASKDARLLWNMAVVQKNLRQYANVKQNVQRYLAEGDAMLTEEDRQQARELLDAIASFITTVTFDVRPDGASLMIDEDVIGTSPLAGPVLADMGKRRLRAMKQGFVTHDEQQEFPGGGSVTVAVVLKEIAHEGRVRVAAGPNQSIFIGGKLVGMGQWEGVLPSGTHKLRVTAPDHKPYESDVIVRDDQLSTMSVSLTPNTPPAAVARDEGGFPWGWVVGGAVVAGGLVAGGFLLLGGEEEGKPTQGTLPPGVATVSF